MSANRQIPPGREFGKRPIGYLDAWKPYGKTQVMLSRVQGILDEYAEYLPLTVRQIYYRMVAAHGYPKGKPFAESLGTALTNARRARIIPFEHIRDDGIMSAAGPWYSGAGAFYDVQRQRAERYARDLQREQTCRVQVWCEAAGMLPQLAKITDRYAIPVYSCSGFNSLTSIRQIVDSCVYRTAGQTVLLHLGDYDPSGESIFERISTDVPAFLEEDALYFGQEEFEAERVALTIDQIRDHDLPMDPIKTKDTRSKAWIKQGRTEKCELEALPPDLISRLLEEAIERHVDDHLLAEARRQEVKDKAIVWMPERNSLPSGISFDRLLDNLRRSNNGGSR